MKFKFPPTPRLSAVPTALHKVRLSSGHQPSGVLPPNELRRIVAEMLG